MWWFEEKKEFTFKDLLDIEQKRRDLLKTAKEFDGNKLVFAFSGTLLPEVMTSPIFVFIFVLYVALRCFIEYGVVERKSLLAMSDSSVATIGGFLSFFLVFFVGQTYSRFTTLFNSTVNMQAKIFNVALLARINLPTNEAWRLLRYCNAAHLVGYVGLSVVYNDKNFFDPMNDQLQLLTPAEVLRVKEIGTDNGGNACRELIGWCLEIVYHHFHTDLLDIYTLEKMVNEILSLRGEVGTLFDFDDQPIPFVYVHLLTFLTHIYMPLLAYSIAISVKDDLQGVLILFLSAVYVLGLVAIGRALMDPFGNDTMDFSVMHFVNSTMLNTRRLMTGRLLAGEGLEVEADLEAKRTTDKGNGYTKNQMKATLYTSVKEHQKFEKPLLRRGDSHNITFGSFHNDISGDSDPELSEPLQQAAHNGVSQKIRKRLYSADTALTKSNSSHNMTNHAANHCNNMNRSNSGNMYEIRKNSLQGSGFPEPPSGSSMIPNSGIAVLNSLNPNTTATVATADNRIKLLSLDPNSINNSSAMLNNQININRIAGNDHTLDLLESGQLNNNNNTSNSYNHNNNNNSRGNINTNNTINVSNSNSNSNSNNNNNSNISSSNNALVVAPHNNSNNQQVANNNAHNMTFYENTNNTNTININSNNNDVVIVTSTSSDFVVHTSFAVVKVQHSGSSNTPFTITMKPTSQNHNNTIHDNNNYNSSNGNGNINNNNNNNSAYYTNNLNTTEYVTSAPTRNEYQQQSPNPRTPNKENSNIYDHRNDHKSDHRVEYRTDHGQYDHRGDHRDYHRDDYRRFDQDFDHERNDHRRDKNKRSRSKSESRNHTRSSDNRNSDRDDNRDDNKNDNRYSSKNDSSGHNSPTRYSMSAGKYRVVPNNID